MSAGEATAVYTREEIAAAIAALTPAQWARLRSVAQLYSYAMPADDLLSEAFLRALSDGGRHCPTEVDVVRFLAEAMRSIANGEHEKAKTRPSFVTVVRHGDQEDGALDMPDESGIPADEWIIREQHAATRRLELLALFDDDEHARDIIEGRMAEMNTEELQKLTGLDSTAYASKLKLIRRRINNKFPKGWRS